MYADWIVPQWSIVKFYDELARGMWPAANSVTRLSGLNFTNGH